MECGQYNDKWRQIHLFPEESVQAALDARVKKAMPVHWAGFSLSQHAWTEPAEQFIAAGKKLNLDVTAPPLGKIVSIFDASNTTPWWD